MPRSAQQLVDAYKGIYAKADAESRDLTPSERNEVAELVEAAQQQKGLEIAIRELDPGAPGSVFTDPSRNGDSVDGDIGAQFVRSEGYKAIKASELRGQRWTSGPVEVSYKGTMLEGAGGTLVPPHYTGGIVRTNFQQVGLVDYFGSEVTPSNSVRYSLEGTATNATDGVPEGSAKPESTLALNEVSEPVKKLATVLPVSDELMEDAPGLRGYINERLTLFIRVTEEQQILRGGGGDDLNGIFNRGISTLGLGASIANHVQIFRAAAGIRGSAFVDPDLVVVHPNDWVTMRLRTDTAGQYLGGGPWQGQYGQQSQVSAGYFSSAPLWNMNVFVSSVVGAGTALVGNAREAARIYRRGGLSIEASNSHSDFFVRNLQMLRAEERLALAVFRPSAWCAVTTLGTIG